MDLSISVLLAQDGITNGAVYALLALAMVLVYVVTRIVFIPQGDFLVWGALTMAALEMGQFPSTIWLLIGVGVLALGVDLLAFRQLSARQLVRSTAWNLAYPLALGSVLALLPLKELPLLVRLLATLAIVVPMGAMLYRVVFQPVANAPVLVLLIIAVALHLTIVGISLLIFGPEGSRTAAFSDAQLELGTLSISGHTLVVLATTAALIVALYVYFDRTLGGKALRATAINRNGARLMGISPAQAGRQTFLIAALIGAFSGALIAPLTTIYYDSGFLIGLKGFVAAIIGGLASYPLAAGGALLVGLIESFSSFWASAFKDVIVFMLIIPVLLWRSLQSHHMEEDE